jgi:hypothetical protein
MRALVVAATLLVLSATPTAMAVDAVRGPAPASAPSAAAVGHVSIVQAVPDSTVDVVVDGDTVASGVSPGEVLGPYPLAAGEHQVDFSGPGGFEQATTVEVTTGSTQDVVLHLPASVGGAAVVTSYQTPNEPIGPDKARVLVAHTATVAAADVRVDGQVVFENIANGEFATADVPAGKHVVALLPTGETGDPILGPLTVDLAARTITMVYAVGNPADDSMTLVAHSAQLAADGSVVPDTIATGSAGLAADIEVVPFGKSPS